MAGGNASVKIESRKSVSLRFWRELSSNKYERPWTLCWTTSGSTSSFSVDVYGTHGRGRTV